jgi:hypothetical protein
MQRVSTKRYENRSKFALSAPLNTKLSSKTAADWGDIKISNKSKLTEQSWYHSID